MLISSVDSSPKSNFSFQSLTSRRMSSAFVPDDFTFSFLQKIFREGTVSPGLSVPPEAHPDSFLLRNSTNNESSPCLLVGNATKLSTAATILVCPSQAEHEFRHMQYRQRDFKSYLERLSTLPSLDNWCLSVPS